MHASETNSFDSFHRANQSQTATQQQWQWHRHQQHRSGRQIDRNDINSYVNFARVQNDGRNHTEEPSKKKSIFVCMLDCYVRVSAGHILHVYFGRIGLFVPVAVQKTLSLGHVSFVVKGTKLTRRKRRRYHRNHTITINIHKDKRQIASTTQKKKFQFHFGSHCFPDSKGNTPYYWLRIYEPPPSSHAGKHAVNKRIRVYRERYLLRSVLQNEYK